MQRFYIVKSCFLIFVLNLTIAECDFLGFETYDIAVHGIPTFVTEDFTELSAIHNISKFRSDEGHDYSDDFESCRSMKHYYKPKDDVDWSDIKIFSPVKGTKN